MSFCLPLAGIPRKQGRSRVRQRVSWISVAAIFFGTVVGAKLRQQAEVAGIVSMDSRSVEVNLPM